LNLEKIINKFDSRRIENDRKGDSFRIYLKTLLEDYNEAIANANLLEDIDPTSSIFVRPYANKIKKQVSELTSGLIAIMDYFLLESCVDGYAFNKFKTVIDSFGALNIPQSSVPRESALYRLRGIDVSELKHIFDRKELFHAPFDKRGIISTNRYSLSGYPCLYLADSIYVAWREITDGKNTKELYTGAKFENTQDLRFLTLDSHPFVERIDKFGTDVILKNTELFQYAGLFPLLAVCSVRVNEGERNYKFKPEYVFPQFLLEYVRKSSILEGIKYRSTRVESNIEAWNYAIPPEIIDDTEYCPKLKNLFRISDTHNFNFLEPHKVDPQVGKKLNINVSKIPLNGSLYLYEETYFAQAEFILDSKIMGGIS
jgi:hypothetical protein